MKIDAAMDITALKSRMPREAKKLATAVARALNRTTLDIQTAERVQIDQNFTVRKAGFIYRLIKITAFASANQGRPYAEIGIDASKARVLLPLFTEDGAEKDPEIGKNVAIPLTGEAARPSFGSLVPQQLTFQALNFKRVSLSEQGRQLTALRKRGLAQVARKLPSNAYIWEGQQRTFIIPDVGVFQRVGPGKADVKMIYAFKPKVMLPKKFDFVGVATRVFGEKFAGYLAEEFDRQK